MIIISNLVSTHNYGHVIHWCRWRQRQAMADYTRCTSLRVWLSWNKLTSSKATETICPITGHCVCIKTPGRVINWEYHTFNIVPLCPNMVVYVTRILPTCANLQLLSTWPVHSSKDQPVILTKWMDQMKRWHFSLLPASWDLQGTLFCTASALLSSAQHSCFWMG